MLQSVSQEMSQGSFVNTGNGLDLAIQGEGFFAVKGTVSGQSSLFLFPRRTVSCG